MLIKDLPPGLQESALQNQQQQIGVRNPDMDLGKPDKSFVWDKSPEGYDYWCDVNEGLTPNIDKKPDIMIQNHSMGGITIQKPEKGSEMTKIWVNDITSEPAVIDLYMLKKIRNNINTILKENNVE